MSTQIADNLNIPNDQWITASVWGYDSKAHFESGSNANLTVYSGYSSHNEYFNGNRSETLTANSAWSQVNGGVPFGSSYGNLAAVRHYSGGSSDVWNGYGGFASSYCGTESQSWNDPSIASYDARNLNGTRFTPHNPPGVPAPYPFSTTSKTFVMPPSLVEDAEAAAGQKQTWLEWAVDQGVGFIPVYGSARDAYRAYKEGDNLGLGLNVSMLGLELFTFGGASVAKGVVKSSLKAEKSLMKLGGKALKSKGDDALKLVDNKIDDVGRSLIDDTAGGAKQLNPYYAPREIDRSPRTPVGRSGQKHNFPNPNAPQPRNPRTMIYEREYSGHAIDRMQERGFVPSVVENAIKTGTAITSRNGTTVFTDTINRLRIIVDTASGRVVTIFPLDGKLQ